MVMKMVKCPHCGESYYAEKYSTCTAVYYPIIWHNGVNENHDGNTTTTYCECLNCHYEFHYSERCGEIEEVILDKKVEPVPVLPFVINDFSNEVSDVPQLPPTITINQSEARETEIARLEQEIKSLQEQLAEIKANPEWHQGVFL